MLALGLNDGYIQALTSRLELNQGEAVTMRASASAKSFQLDILELDALVKQEPRAWMPALQAELPAVMKQAVYSTKKFTTVGVGAQPAYPLHNSLTLQAGRFISEADERNRSHVAVLGAKTAESLFGTAQPLGKFIELGKARFRVVGVLSPTRAFGFAADREVIIPYATALEMDRQSIIASSRIAFQVLGSTPGGAAEVVVSIRARARRAMGAEMGIEVTTGTEILASARTLAKEQSLILSLIAILTVGVASLAIMNIYFVSVAQRTKEIGIRMAVGATRADVMLIVVRESVITAVLGAVLGIIVALLIGSSFARFIRSIPAPVYLPESFIYVSAGALVTAILVSLLPAYRASRCDPIVAINAVGV